jgi:nitroreductase
MIRDNVIANRSYRRFKENESIADSVLRELVDLGRLSASAANLQSMKYILSTSPERNDLIFPTLGWAGYLTEWSGPAVGERPSAYIVMLLDTNISRNPFCDHGIAAQSILLGAAEKGIGGCMIGSVNKDDLRAALKITEQYEILLVLALGIPAETVVLEEMETGGSIKYYRDDSDVHHVPKRKLDDVILDI